MLHVDDGSSFKAQIIRLTVEFIDITIIGYTLLFVSLIFYYSIRFTPLFYAPLLWRFEIFDSIFTITSVENFPLDQIKPHLFIHIKSIEIYNSTPLL